MTAPPELWRVMVVDDDDDLRHAHIQSLALAGFEAEGMASADQALPRIDARFDGIVVSDIRMPGMDGLTFADRLRAIDADIPVILMTGHGDIDMAVQALQSGAFDFLAKPFGSDRLLISVRRALKQRALVLENRRLADLLALASHQGAETGLIGQSSSVVRLRADLSRVAEADTDVLIEGESGVGKALAAGSLHRLGRRARRPFVSVNCAALPEASFDTELFGHQTTHVGIGRRIGGRVREAEGGTLLFDEIEALSPSLQAKLLRLVEQRELPPEGDRIEHADLRILATSKIDLGEATRQGAFRADLYYRLSVVTLRLPPLRERRSDIDLLFRHFVDRASRRQGVPVPVMDDPCTAWLHEHDWPGNVRELEHFAERFVLGLRPGEIDDDARHDTTLSDRVQRFEARLMAQALTETQGDVRRTLDLLKIPRKTFYDKVARHGLALDMFRTMKRP